MTSNTQNQPDQNVAGSGENPTAVADAGTELPVPVTEPGAQPQADLEAAKAESDQWRDRFLRKAAELENFRKRTERERREAAANVASSLLAEMLPIMDACERAMDSFKDGTTDSGKLQRYREGVELLYKQLGSTLSRLGVVPLEAKGHKFDPQLHDALTHLESQDYEDNTVVEELRRGYLFKGRLLRPAQVVVASRPKPKEDVPKPKEDGAAQ